MTPALVIPIERMRRLDPYCPDRGPYKKSSVFGTLDATSLASYAVTIVSYLEKRKQISQAERWYLYFLCRKLEQLGAIGESLAIDRVVSDCRVTDLNPFRVGGSARVNGILGLENATRVNWRFLPSPENLSANDLLQLLKLHFEQHGGGSSIHFELKRIEFELSLKPEQICVGTEEFAGYYAFVFPGDVVLFECPAYGNAAYVVRGDWRTLSKQFKAQLKRKGTRVIHGSRSWKRAIRRAMNSV